MKRALEFKEATTAVITYRQRQVDGKEQPDSEYKVEMTLNPQYIDVYTNDHKNSVTLYPEDIEYLYRSIQELKNTKFRDIPE